MTHPTDPLDELGPRLSRRRAELGLGVREAAEQAGVPSATFSRVERGRTPDLATFRRLVGWLGVPPSVFFLPTERPESTPQAIADHLQTDPALSAEAATKIAELVESMYETLAKRERRITVHLRAAKTFKPTALHLLSSLLDDMQSALEARDAR